MSGFKPRVPMVDGPLEMWAGELSIAPNKWRRTGYWHEVTHNPEGLVRYVRGDIADEMMATLEEVDLKLGQSADFSGSWLHDAVCAAIDKAKGESE